MGNTNTKICKFAILCLSLPDSDANIGRSFSFSVNEIQTRGRNKLKPKMVTALSRIRLDFRNLNACCYYN